MDPEEFVNEGTPQATDNGWHEGDGEQDSISQDPEVRYDDEGDED